MTAYPEKTTAELDSSGGRSGDRRRSFSCLGSLAAFIFFYLVATASDCLVLTINNFSSNTFISILPFQPDRTDI
jgi:hypothetical protein